MGTAQSIPSSYCLQCGAQLPAGVASCWLCYAASLPGDAAQAGARIPSRPPADQRPAAPTGHLQFSLSSLLLFVTLIAILSSLIGMHRGMGIAVAIVAVPALVRTCITAMRRGARGQPLSVEGKVAVFLLTVSMTVIVIVAAVGAFVFTFLTTCAVGAGRAGGSGLDLLPLAINLGLVAGLLTGLVCAGLFWKLSHRTHNP